ncbi:MAG: hypothetical protein LBV53_01320 [Mycoplasmataceae bacterium]|jgi:chemotaxis methyl-accepting protein methylase|nr:hypothetical protein [Mycoplasmataceae bacterium]
MNTQKKISQHVEGKNFDLKEDKSFSFDIIKSVKVMTDSQKLDLILKKISELEKDMIYVKDVLKRNNIK